MLKNKASIGMALLASCSLLSSCSSFYFDEIGSDENKVALEMQNIEEQIIQVPVEDELYSFHTHKKS